MGYTHYFEQKKSATPEQWGAICGEFKQLMAAVKLPIQRECDDKGPVLIDNATIAFNGIGEHGHETMYVEREGKDFQFCKTARKSYDKAVIALLLIMHKHASDVWNISSDGDRDDWQAVVTWLSKQGTPKKRGDKVTAVVNRIEGHGAYKIPETI